MARAPIPMPKSDPFNSSKLTSELESIVIEKVIIIANKMTLFTFDFSLYLQELDKIIPETRIEQR